METVSGDRSVREYRLPAVAREGAIGGLVGAFPLAIWFLVNDTMAGQPLLTPALARPPTSGDATPICSAVWYEDDAQPARVLTRTASPCTLAP